MNTDGVVEAYVLSAAGATPSPFLIFDGTASNLEPITLGEGDLLTIGGHMFVVRFHAHPAADV